MGANRPGTKAYRQLLKQTVSDPQQRLARMLENQFPTKDNSSSSSRTLGSSYDNNNSGANNNLETSTAYQNLQNKVLELQLELNATRIERDGMAVELSTARDTIMTLHNNSMNLSIMDLPNNQNELRNSLSSNPTGNNNNNVWERDIKNLKEIIQRKDDTIEHLQVECRRENFLRTQVEDDAKTKITEILNSLEESKR